MYKTFKNLIKQTVFGAFIVSSVSLFAVSAYSADYHVGPNQPLTALADVNWSSLSAGDTVYIHYGVYHEKFNLSSRGTADNPIRVIGIPDANGNRPVIDARNATTPASSDFRWQSVSTNGIQWLGAVFITPGPGENAVLPGHIEIKNLEIRNAYTDSTFTGEDGSTSTYNGFAAGIYIRSAQHVLIENCVIHNNGQGIYSWTGAGQDWWDGLVSNVTIRGNHFYNNGHVSSYTEHQTYLEGYNTVYEYNHYGPQRPGAYGSDLKDRGAGTVVRYNYFETAPAGWWIDLVEPENGWMALGFSNPAYSQAFIYGNLFVNNNNSQPNYFHWNEDHQAQGNNGTPGPNGRATMDNGRLYFYNNTVVTVGNRSDFGYNANFTVFNTTWGGYECASAGSRPGVIDVRNNIFAVIPRTPGASVPTQRFAYCGDQNLNFGTNLVTDGWITNTSGSVTGTQNLITVSSNEGPGFADASAFNFRLTPASTAVGVAGPLSSAVVNNEIGMNLTPNREYVFHLQSQARAGSDLGAFGFGSQESVLAPPTPPVNLSATIVP